ncbi:MAG: glutamine-hydrolyzing carbamoyl-phosphate synthase small subunit [Desulfovibrio sp.]|jgi:carbamoyl-phosphate synthase small subunit|nr:glutamine-hydrolyzing carbamoyl-phosphate synthase small subunit [Desulfovibrio sp.]
MTKPALLMLDDGVCFEGEARGAAGEAAGEVVFTTSMAGYQETLTDPSYFGQIVAFTAAQLGNYGATPLDDESPAPRVAGAVFHDLFTAAENMPFPHWRAGESLDAKLARQGISAIAGLDTRALTLHLREHGSRGGILSALDLDRPSLLRRARALPPMQGQDLARKVSCAQPYAFSPPPPDSPSLRVAVLDCGVKRSILVNLARLGMAVSVWPAATSAADILASKPDGVLLPNGPGDPEPCVYAIAAIRRLLGRVPLFGICLGHQLLGLALGARTYKLPFGHHGVNHPVLDISTRRVLITSQNHGFCVDPDSLPARAAPSHWNLNDDTLEGLVVKDAPAFSVQFHPEAVPGPTEAGDLFLRFRDLILQAK